LTAALVCIASAFARGATLDLTLPRFTHAEAILRAVVPVAFAPASMWQFALMFPRVDRFTAFDVIARRAMACAWVLGGVLFGATLTTALGMPGIAAIAGPNGTTHTFWHLFVMALLPAIVVLAVRSRRAPAAERRRIVRFAGTLAAGSAPLLVFGALRMAVPAVDRWFVASGAGGHAWIDRLVLWPLAATPLLSSAVLLLDRPFESQSTPGLPSRSGLARAALWLSLLTPFAALAVLMYRLRRVAIGDLPVTGGWLVLITAGASVVVLTIVARVIAGGLVVLANDRRRISRGIERLRHARGERELAALLAGEIGAGTQARFWRVLFPVADGSFVDPMGETAPMPSSTALAAIVLRTTGAIDVSEHGLGPLLPPVDRLWVESHGIKMAAALKDRAGSPIAVLAFGEKRSGRFNRRDRWLTATLVGAAVGAASGGEPIRRRRSGRAQEPAFECPRCGTVARSFTACCGCESNLILSALPRRLAGRFAIERRLGSGGMGEVYRGRDLALRRAVAMKTVPALRGEGGARLRVEARAMAALNHDALATVYGLEFWRGTPVLVQEYLPGGTLASRLVSGPLQPSEAAAIVVRIADALAYMHERGVLHGDVKPANIAFTAAGSAKLLDFGLSALIGSTALACAGTPDYLPPECAGQTTVAPSLDLWALSVTFLEMVAGRGTRTAARSRRALAAALGAAVFDGNPELRSFFERALAVDPSSRISTAVEMSDTVRRIMPSAPPRP
jgi:hypothetical protein